MNLKEIQNLERILFYDGDCGFCNSSVQLVLNKRRNEFYFLALQKDLAHKIMAKFNEEIQMNTLYLIEDNKLYQKSTAALKIAKNLKGAYPLLYYFGSLVPRFLRDWVYDQVAKRRHNIKPGFCAMPKQKDKQYFL